MIAREASKKKCIAKYNDTNILNIFATQKDCTLFVSDSFSTKHDVFENDIENNNDSLLGSAESLLGINQDIPTIFVSNNKYININTTSKRIIVHYENISYIFYPYCYQIYNSEINNFFLLLKNSIIKSKSFKLYIFKHNTENHMYCFFHKENAIRYLKMIIQKQINGPLIPTRHTPPGDIKPTPPKPECNTDNTEINDSLLVCTSLPEEDDLNGGSRKKTKSYKLLEERIIIPGTKRPRRVFIRHGTKYVSSTKSKTGYITLKRVLALAKAK